MRGSDAGGPTRKADPCWTNPELSLSISDVHKPFLRHAGVTGPSLELGGAAFQHLRHHPRGHGCAGGSNNPHPGSQGNPLVTCWMLNGCNDSSWPLGGSGVFDSGCNTPRTAGGGKAPHTMSEEEKK